MLGDEFGTASNIKNRVNRQSVLGAITSAQQRLKLYNKVGCKLWTDCHTLIASHESKPFGACRDQRCIWIMRCLLARRVTPDIPYSSRYRGRYAAMDRLVHLPVAAAILQIPGAADCHCCFGTVSADCIVSGQLFCPCGGDCIPSLDSLPLHDAMLLLLRLGSTAPVPACISPETGRKACGMRLLGLTAKPHTPRPRPVVWALISVGGAWHVGASAGNPPAVSTSSSYCFKVHSGLWKEGERGGGGGGGGICSRGRDVYPMVLWVLIPFTTLLSISSPDADPCQLYADTYFPIALACQL